MYINEKMQAVDDELYATRDVMRELKYHGDAIPDSRNITVTDIRFLAWLCRAALQMLKGKDPRVLAWEELFPMDSEKQPFTVWAEDRELSADPFQVAFIDGQYVNTDCTWYLENRLDNMRDYGKTYRCWTGRPTKTQRWEAEWGSADHD